MLDNCETPAAASAEIAAHLAAEHQELEATCGGRPLSLSAPADCPRNLAVRMDTYNSVAVKFIEQRGALDELLTALPHVMTDATVDAAGHVQRGASLRGRRFILAREQLALLEARRSLLGQVAALVATRVAGAEKALAAARDDARRALKDSGWTPPTARERGAGRFPEAEAAEIEEQVGGVQTVMAGQEALDDARQALADIEEAAAPIGAGVATANKQLVRAWRLLVGDLV